MKKILFVIGMLLCLSGCNNPVDNTTPVDDKDTEKPVITLNGDETVYVNLKKDYEELGAVVTDNKDANLDVIIEGTVDTETIGEYFITYYSKDEAGNEHRVTRTVYVINKMPGLLGGSTYEGIDLFGYNFGVIDPNRLVEDVKLELFDGEEVISTKIITYDEEANDYLNHFGEFNNLEHNVDYELVITMTYDTGLDIGNVTQEVKRVNVGCYRTLTEEYEDIYDEEAMFEVVSKLVYLPYQELNKQRTREHLELIGHINIEVLRLLAEREWYIVYGNDRLTSIYEYKDFYGIERYPGQMYQEVPYFGGTPGFVEIDFSTSRYSTTLFVFGYISLPVMHAMDQAGLNGVIIEYFGTTDLDENNMQFLTDMFIDAFSMYYYTDSSREELIAQLPEFYDFFENFERTMDGPIT